MLYFGTLENCITLRSPWSLVLLQTSQILAYPCIEYLPHYFSFSFVFNFCLVIQIRAIVEILLFSFSFQISFPTIFLIKHSLIEIDLEKKNEKSNDMMHKKVNS